MLPESTYKLRQIESIIWEVIRGDGVYDDDTSTITSSAMRRASQGGRNGGERVRRESEAEDRISR